MERSTLWVVLGLGLLAGPGSAAGAEGPKKVLVIGIDGLDPEILQELVREDALPHFEKLLRRGEFRPLQTSTPPLSPVAWSNFITGLDPGGHGIFDFVHRDPETLQPYLSMARAEEAGRALRIGSLSIPLSSASVEQLRKGRAFWEILQEHGISTTVYRIPVNFPPVECGGRSLSGMGTPDILGTPGTFSFYTDCPPEDTSSITGGVVRKAVVRENRVRAQLIGPRNTFRVAPGRTRKSGASREQTMEHPPMTVDFTVYMDPEDPVAKLAIGGEEIVLAEGEWSDWVPVKFEALPLVANVHALARFYLKELRPCFRLYVSPLQIDPAKPAMPISTPSSWSCHLCESLGYFYTQELPEDTKALSAGLLTVGEFWSQAHLVYAERKRALEHLLGEFHEGLLFFYFSSVDQLCHMLWRNADPEHPGHSPEEHFRDGIRRIYQEVDRALGDVLDHVDTNTTLIVMSDHGFAPFYRGVNLNTWLLQKGYVHLKDPSEQGKHPLFRNVDWSRTHAYALGLNGLYVNTVGRERNGLVRPGAELEALLDRLERDLLSLRDPANGNQVVTQVVRARRDFHGPHASTGPDIIVGYNRGYRSSWESPLGQFPIEVFVDNKDAWSGDHAMDSRLVPGVLLTNRVISVERPALHDLTVAILDEFGIAPLEEMRGTDCLAEPRLRTATTDP